MSSEVGFMQRNLNTIVLVIFLGLLGPGFAATNVIVGWSESGLHETDGADVSVYTLAPPYSTIHAQFVSNGKLVTNAAGVTMTYQAVADGSGSINTTSQRKGNFYQYVQQLFGANLAPDQGLAGFGMPGANNRPQVMSFDPAQGWFTSQGIPLTPYDDQGRKNYYPMMRLVARDSSSNVLATTDIVVPVSDEMHCASCHASGSQTAARPPEGWVWALDPDKDYKMNVLRSHDDHFLGSAIYTESLAAAGYDPAGLLASATKHGQPILCIKCHASNALPGPQITNVFSLTQVMHSKHAYVSDPVSGQALSLMTNSAACMLCHSAPENRRVRGVHHNPVNNDGTLALQCQSCHGSVSVLGAVGRQGWLEEPNCQSCHTGTATSNNGALRYTSAFDTNGQPRQAVNSTYATLADTPSAGLSLYRFSHEHAGLKCAACHGPSHAEVLSTQANDNVQNAALQSSAGGGILTDCAVCHLTRPSPLLGGPHAMHPVDAQWAAGHDNVSRTQCQACHGADYRGTVLSWAQGNRVYQQNGQFWHGFQIGCYTCHNGPNGGDTGGVAALAATANSLSANTVSETPVNITLVASGPVGVTLAYRVVTQPVHGTVSVAGNIATYFPAPGYVGTDSFTYTAWDLAADSNLGTVTVTTVPGQCYLTTSTLVPTAAFPNSTVPFRANAALSQCAGTITYDWDFGDGSAHGSGTNVSHVYTKAADYNWTLKVAANGTNQTVTGVIAFSPTLGPPVALTITPSAWSVNLSWPA
ncbi:MAG TPA: PKD domain-containing protein, partial [Verrucomicrobiae bacterium]|nr:PKD domain-containing protein [Verrucomicrobiae bacterium]